MKFVYHLRMKDTGLAHRYKLKTAKWFLAFAVLLFVAKPFIGFALNTSTPVSKAGILVKAFTKRKHEYVENSSFDVKTIQKQLASPVNQLILLFSALLSIIFPLLFAAGFNVTNRFIQKIKQSLNPSSHSWLLNSQLII
jgi:hypothetical protein